MQMRAILSLAVGGLVIGLLGGLAIGGDGGSKTGQVTAPGPTKTVGRVPVGYARTQEGAVAAATSYAQSIGSLALMTREERDTALSAMVDPEVRDEVREGLMPGLDVLGKGLTTPNSADAVVRAAPIGYRVGSYSQDRAEIELWAVGVVGNGPALPPSATWGITRVTLGWLDGDWKLSASIKQSEGPTPQLSGAPSPPEAFAQQIRDFRSLHDGPVD